MLARRNRGSPPRSSAPPRRARRTTDPLVGSTSAAARPSSWSARARASSSASPPRPGWSARPSATCIPDPPRHEELEALANELRRDHRPAGVAGRRAGGGDRVSWCGRHRDLVRRPSTRSSTPTTRRGSRATVSTARALEAMLGWLAEIDLDRPPPGERAPPGPRAHDRGRRGDPPGSATGLRPRRGRGVRARHPLGRGSGQHI